MARYQHGPKPPKQSFKVLLDQFSVHDLERWNKLREGFLRYHWDYYSSLAYQRSQIADDIRRALLEATESRFLFSKWQRVVRYRYALKPLSLQGSLIDPGGRFNIWDINPAQFPLFPALYLAVDRGTALQEMFSQSIGPADAPRALEFALTAPESITAVSVSGFLDSVIDLRKPAKLQKFVDLIKDFAVPKHLIETAKKIGEQPPDLLRDTETLLKALLVPNWRSWPMLFDVPTASQIFVQLVDQARIQAISYPSKFSGGDCLAIFPRNFENSDAFVELDDASPLEVGIRRLDATTWQKLES